MKNEINLLIKYSKQRFNNIIFLIQKYQKNKYYIHNFYKITK